jgi:diadenosine tetraphosphate (Ap4A) HIT family hydrolase
MASARTCEAADFCSEFAGAADVSFFRVYEGDPATRLIADREGLRLVADMSPLVLGHMLLMPVEHYLSFATVVHERVGAVRRMLSWLKPIYLRTFDRFSILEHGSSDDLPQSACITHAHWHIVPLDLAELSQVIVSDGLSPFRFTELSQLSGPWCRSSYFYVSDGGDHFLFEPTGGQPKQYLRSVMGRVLSIGDPEWDYAVVVRKDLLRQTLRRTAAWGL